MRNVTMLAVRIVLVAGLVSSVAGCAHMRCGTKQLTRYGSVIGLNPEKLERYKELHANAWPGVLKMITECNIQNYSIYLLRLKEGEYYLFSYFEYTGDDFGADMAKMAADPVTQEWWEECEPCQLPLPNRKEGEWWHDIEEVFHHD